MGKYKGAFGNGGGFVDNKDYSKEIASEFEGMTEEEIVVEAKNGNSRAQEYVISKYESFVKVKSKSYFLIGADKEDIYQEGMIGLYKAIRDFNYEKSTTFRGFAELCITRQIITAIKTATRQKHIPLNSSVSLNAAAYDDNEDVDKIDILDIKALDDPSDIIAEREYFESMENKIKEALSKFELQVLHEYEKGKSYADIAAKLNAKVKSVDTAIQRIRKKANKIKDVEY